MKGASLTTEHCESRMNNTEGKERNARELTPRGSGSETILLVESDDQMRKVMRVILQREGYEILEAQNAGEAITIAEGCDSKIHLLITDIAMPHMSGLVLAERLASRRSALRVLYTSGYSEDWVVRQGVLDAGSFGFLQKPITPALLSQKVRDILGIPQKCRESE